MLVYVRPSNEALLRARVPGAQDQRGCPSHPVSPISTDDARYHTAQWDSGIGACLI